MRFFYSVMTSLNTSTALSSSTLSAMLEFCGTTQIPMFPRVRQVVIEVTPAGKTYIEAAGWAVVMQSQNLGFHKAIFEIHKLNWPRRGIRTHHGPVICQLSREPLQSRRLLQTSRLWVCACTLAAFICHGYPSDTVCALLFGVL